MITNAATIGLRPAFDSFTFLRTRVERWAEESQLGARRNAMVACTALAQRRAEREDVDRFFVDNQALGDILRLRHG